MFKVDLLDCFRENVIPAGLTACSWAEVLYEQHEQPSLCDSLAHRLLAMLAFVPLALLVASLLAA